MPVQTETPSEECHILDPRDLAENPEKLKGLQKEMFAFLMKSRGRVSEDIFNRKCHSLMNAAATHDKLRNHSGDLEYKPDISEELAGRMTEELGKTGEGNLAKGIDGYYRTIKLLHKQVDTRFSVIRGDVMSYDMRYLTNMDNPGKQAMAVDMAAILAHQRGYTKKIRQEFIDRSPFFAEAERTWALRSGIEKNPAFMEREKLESESNRALDLFATSGMDTEAFMSEYMGFTSDMFHHMEDGIAVPGLLILEKDDEGERTLDKLSDEFEKVHLVLSIKNRSEAVLHDIVGIHRYLTAEILAANERHRERANAI